MTDTIQEHLRWKGDQQGDSVLKEAADEIDRLQSKLKDSRGESARLERERDEARTKFDESLEERDVILDENRRFRSELVDCIARIGAVEKESLKLRTQLAAKDKHIEDLERTFGKDSVTFTTEQINEAWGQIQELKSQGTTGTTIALVLAELLETHFNIIPCPKCGGTKARHMWGDTEFVCIKCDCPNNGWVTE